MNVVEEKIDALNAVLRVKIAPEDYADKVENTLKDYRKQANMPGFRPGKTPISLIKKKYGKAVLAEELNKAVSQSLHDFITSNNINILGNPLPKEDEEVKGDFDNPTEFEFVYEIGITPEFDLKLSKKNKFEHLTVKVDKDMLDKEVENLARRYGKLVSEEAVGERDMVMGEFTEVKGEIKNNSTISMEYVEDKATQKKFIGAKVGDVINIDPKKVSKGEQDMASMLGITEEEAAGLKSKFDFKITEIKRMIPADVNQELFDKLFGEGNVKSEKELRERIEADLKNMFANDSDRILNQKMVDELVDKTKVDLPEEFLKRWILASAKEEITSDQIEADFDNYKKSLKWQLIQNKIIKDNDIKVDPQEAVDYTKSLLVNQYAQYGMPAPDDEQLDGQAKNVLSNQEEANRIYDNLYNNKIMAHLKEAVTLTEKALPYEKFIEQAYSN
ncbi:trigger factor [Paracrocinitomix mangrovi]|uniref:trigger factor n=1 Tax=Paracrocinitomix mangrovi TaxID=2862509 RepID=UPI001C8E5A5C|nr:trigger factor [Paracrocinitomix mangrovi]UKN00393.1 trigger factor [Paracrocinitomix mangrovi]